MESLLASVSNRFLKFLYKSVLVQFGWDPASLLAGKDAPLTRSLLLLWRLFRGHTLILVLGAVRPKVNFFM